MVKAKNICPKCGNRLVIEAVGIYGDIYYMKRNGEMGTKRIRRCIYETTGEYLIYCKQCGHQILSTSSDS